MADSYGFFIFDRITPIIDHNIAAIFSPSFTLEHFDRTAQLAFFRGDLNPWRKVLLQNLIERVEVKLSPAAYSLGSPVVFAEAKVNQATDDLSDPIPDPCVSVIDGALNELADEIIKNCRYGFRNEREPVSGKMS